MFACNSKNKRWDHTRIEEVGWRDSYAYMDPLNLIWKKKIQTLKVDCAEEGPWTLAFLKAAPVAVLLHLRSEKKKGE